MKREELEERIALLYDLMHATHGSGIDYPWVFAVKDPENGYLYPANFQMTLFDCQDKVLQFRSKSITIANSFHCLDENGNYHGWADFSVIFPNNKSLDEYRIVFHGAESQRLQKKHDIKEYLDQVIIGAIHDLQETQNTNNTGNDTGSSETRKTQA